MESAEIMSILKISAMMSTDEVMTNPIFLCFSRRLKAIEINTLMINSVKMIYITIAPLIHKNIIIITSDII